MREVRDHGDGAHRPARVALGVALWGALAAMTACGPVARGAFAGTGYTSEYGYEITYRNGTRRVLPPEWNVDNFYLRGPEWIRKDRDDYVTKYAVDHNDDDVPDSELQTFTYDLRYEHRVHSGVVWLRNIPISARLGSRDLRVLMQSYIDDIAGATYETVQLGSPRTALFIARRQAAVVVEEGPATVAGQPAYSATIDVADVEQIKLDPGVRARRVQVVLMRAPRDEKIKKGETTWAAPVVVIAGYSNLPPDFQTGIPDFHDFLQRLTIAGRSGLTLHMVPTDPRTQPAVAAPTPPTTPPALSP